MLDKVILMQVFSDYLSFPCEFSSHKMLYTYLSSGVGTRNQLVADVPSGLRSHPTKVKKKKAVVIEIVSVCQTE
jgi:hypothetical protein